jgi:LmbE family N-acetylglucosaminyl deacetylase
VALAKVRATRGLSVRFEDCPTRSLECGGSDNRTNWGKLVADRLTLMAVHAHPDDEVITTGGSLARYTEEGVRTVLVTCTNGEQGDGPGGVKPGEPGHDAAEVRRVRLAELQASAAHLGISEVELLGYQDSGMEGWDANNDPFAFANVPLEESTGRLITLIERYRPQVILAYDENGGYGHPDHIQAHRIAAAAFNASDIPSKLYYSAIPRSWFRRMVEHLRSTGVPESELEISDDFGTPDEDVTTVIDAAPYADRKRKALQAHASQSDSDFLLQLPEDMQQAIFSTEAFIRAATRTTNPTPESDLFAGLR